MRGLKWAIPFALVGAVACAEGERNGTDEGAEMDEGTVMGSELACAPTATGAELSSRASPYDSTDIEIDGTQARVCYSRPFLRGRTMIGGDAVPFDTIWRTGANEPTIINLDGPASIAGIDVDAGSYSLYTVPRETGDWTLIVNSSTSQWGHESRYTDEVREQEVGRTDVAAETVEETVEQFTIRPMEGEETGVLVEWQNYRVHIPITPG